jgi:hypothetical protein
MTENIVFDVWDGRKNCPACGKELFQTMKYCTSCGADIEYWLGGLSPSNFLIQTREQSDERYKQTLQRAKEEQEQNKIVYMQLQTKINALDKDILMSKKRLKRDTILIAFLQLFVLFEIFYFIFT